MALRSSEGEKDTASAIAKEMVRYDRLWGVGLGSALLATGANFAIWGLGVGLGTIDPGYPLLAPVPIIAGSVVPPLAASLTVALLGRLTLAGVLLAISFSGPLSAGAGGIPDAPVAPPSTVAFMLAMHMVEAAIVVVLLTRLAGMGGRPPHPEPKEPGK